MSTPLVSVVIPAYRASKIVGESVESALAQDFEDVEVLVINDGSPDAADMERNLEPYLDRIRYFVQRHQGPAAARNYGIREARGRYIAFLDSDDMWSPDFLTAQVDRLQGEPVCDMVYSDATLFGDRARHGDTFMAHCPSSGPVTPVNLIEARCVVLTSTVVVRKEVLELAGLFDERYMLSEDYDLWLRIALVGARIDFQTRVLGYHRKHTGSLTAPAGVILKSQIEVIRNMREDHDLPASVRDAIDQRIQQCIGRLALLQGKQHLVAGDYDEAAMSFHRAAMHLESPKVKVVEAAARYVPRTLRLLYRRWRQEESELWG